MSVLVDGLAVDTRRLRGEAGRSGNEGRGSPGCSRKIRVELAMACG